MLLTALSAVEMCLELRSLVLCGIAKFCTYYALVAAISLVILFAVGDSHKHHRVARFYRRKQVNNCFGLYHTSKNIVAL